MDNDADGEGTLGRSRRQKSDRHGRVAAFDRFKQLKGSKNKYSVTEEVPVYDLVDEKEYSKLVQERQEEDWIIDDGTGYVEDGRELFDDDEDDTNRGQTKKTDKAKNVYKPPPSGKPTKSKDIKSMFMNAAPKKKPESNINLEDDELLGNIMQNIHNSISPITPKPTLLRKKISPASTSEVSQAKKPINPFASTTPQFKSSRRSLRPLELDTVKETDVNLKQANEKRNTKRKLLEESVETIGAATSFQSKKQIKIDVEENNIEEIDSQASDFTKVQDKDDIRIEDFDDDFFMDDDLDLPEMNDVESKETSKKNFLEESVKDSSNNSSFVTEWDNITFNIKESVVEVQVDSSELPLTTNKNGDKVLRIFWLDAFEDQFKHPGVVYLFGKIWVESAKSHISCCVIAKNIERRVFFLPREKRKFKNGQEGENPIIMSDVYEEFSDKISDKFGIKEFKCKPSKKKYAFEKPEVPTECEFLEVRYSAKYKTLPADLSGETFSSIFGHNTSSLEQFLIDRKIKGPMWLEIQEPAISNPPISWCKMEVSVDSMLKVSVVEDQPPKPDLVIMSLYLRTINNPTNHQNEITAVACCVHSKFPLTKKATTPYESVVCALSKPSDRIFPFDLSEKVNRNKRMKIELINSERSLLIFLLAKIHKIDPDIIVGHDLIGFDLELLLHRLSVLNVPNWSRVGRLRRSIIPKRSGQAKGQLEKLLTSGRLVCDIKVSAQELLRCRSYELLELISQVLHCTHKTIDLDSMKNMYSSSEQLLKLMELTLMESSFIVKIMAELNILPLALQITNIAGNLMGRTLLGGRSERNEFLLLHAFNAKNYICPDKVYGRAAKEVNVDEDNIADMERTGNKGPRRKKAAYAGGLVLEPKKGFYDHFILLMDFNSLYPSIIQEYNICFTTVKRYVLQETGDDNPVAELPDLGQEIGILPHEIQKLVESRREVKKLMGAANISPEQRMQYDIRQKALKLTANSMYGCLGFSHSRFYAKPLAALITGKGRDILLQTKSLVEKMGLEVVYGDTDSIMINTNSKDIGEVLDLGKKIKKEVNKTYRLLEIEVDGLFKCMLLLKKKKYAALTLTKLPNGEIKTNKELKGLDIVRRDWSDIAKKAGEFVIDVILSNKSQDEICESVHDHLLKLGENINNGQIMLTDYLITKQLTKNPEDYPENKSLSHVQVGIRINLKGGKKLKQGDTVPYLICEDGTSNSAVQRAYHPDELKNNPALKIDTLYYKQQQILPVVSRLCEPIAGLDAPVLAEKLGLDPTSYIQAAKSRLQMEDNVQNEGYPVMNLEDRFENCEPLTFVCPNKNCAKEIIVKESLCAELERGATKYQFTLLQCKECHTRLADFVPPLRVYLKSILDTYIKKYYLFWMFCEDVGCGYRTRKIPLIFSRAGPTCPSCSKSTLRSEYSEFQLYHQLLYISRIVDIDKAIQKLPNGEKDLITFAMERTENIYLYRKLKEVVDQELKRNRYGEVDLCSLFEGLYKPANKA